MESLRITRFGWIAKFVALIGTHWSSIDLLLTYTALVFTQFGHRFEYNISRDCGCLPRLSSFKKDQDVPEVCQQNSTSAYPAVNDSLGTVHRYDRGHQVRERDVGLSCEVARVVVGACQSSGQ